MRLPLIILFSLLICGQLTAQEESYFQQEVHYTIDVTLNDSSHVLSGTEWLKYINHSPDTLDLMYFHLWPNAYSGKGTDFAEQQVRQGSSKFYFAEEEDLGGFRVIDFQAGGLHLDWVKESGHEDVVRVQLNAPLFPGDTMVLKIPFVLDIPASFSRLGHVEESYQMTQWYPKPAVYDQDGWHPMPYLDTGEFYSEFGSFEVAITLPENYVVAATGELQETFEKDFLEDRIAWTEEYISENVSERIPFWDAFRQDTFPPSSPNMKTISFRAENVHDFAWFADKRFRVMARQFALPNGKSVMGFVYFTFMEEWYWKEALDYVERSTVFYSEKVGAYPWPHVTAVQSALSAGGGMEYPMITVIGLSGDPQALDEVITHEVGHNWFYGILGSNERDHAWMDEGLNSYYDHRYTEAYYGIPKGDYYLPNFLAKSSDLPFYDLSYLYFTRSGREQAPSEHSESFFPGGYYMGAYEKPALALRHLENYWGKERFDAAMQAFYSEWAFKHPSPENFRESLESFGNEDLSWLFDGYLGSIQSFDYSVHRVKVTDDSLRVLVRNNGEFAPPFPLSGMEGEEVVQTEWQEGFTGSRWISFPDQGSRSVVIDPERRTADLYPNNNSRDLRGGFAGLSDYRLHFLSGIDHSEHKHIYWSPLLGWNDYDKWMVGIGLHNYSIIERRMEWAFMPVYSFVSNSVSGLANLQFNQPLRNSEMFRRFRLGSSWKKFSENYNFQQDYRLRYGRGTFYADLDWNMQGSKGLKRLYVRADRTSVERPRIH